ncbi:MAG: DoxX family protein [Candidatus Krumholzibacteriia bacterium]
MAGASNRLARSLTAGIRGNALTVDLGLLVLRVTVGLAFATVFEKFLPRDGVWGPQPWFVDDVARMGFPLPVVFAWLASLSEFVGGILLVLGLWTRPAALANCGVTAVALFVYHDGDIGQTGLTAAVFLVMCTTLALAGPGRVSADGWLARRGR